MASFRLSLSAVIECDAEQAQAVAGIVAVVLTNMGANKPKVSIEREPVALCADPENPRPEICTDCPNFGVHYDGGAYCQYSLKAVF